MTYLITGGSGFIGSHLVEHLLKNGHSVISIDNFDDFYDYRIKVRNTLESVGIDPHFSFEDKELDIQKLIFETSNTRFQLYYQDIRDQEGLRKIFAKHPIELVIHLAALAGVRPSIDFKINKFVCASSSSVYGNNVSVPFRETDSVDAPISPYAATKRSCEILGHVYHHLNHIDMIQLRFFTVYGPRQRPDLAIHKFTKLIAENKEIPFYGDGTTSRDYTYIDDIILGILRSIRYLETHDHVYEIINLGENEVVSLQEMVNILEMHLDKKAIKKNLPLQPGDVQILLKRVIYWVIIRPQNSKMAQKSLWNGF